MSVPASLSLSPSAKRTRDVKRTFRVRIHPMLLTDIRAPRYKRIILPSTSNRRRIVALHPLVPTHFRITTLYAQSHTIRAYNLYRASVAGNHKRACVTRRSSFSAPRSTERGRNFLQRKQREKRTHKSVCVAHYTILGIA